MTQTTRQRAEEVAHEFYWCLTDPGMEKQLADDIEALILRERAEEREACARCADLRAGVFGGEPTTPNEQMLAEHIAAAIRTRPTAEQENTDAT